MIDYDSSESEIDPEYFKLAKSAIFPLAALYPGLDGSDIGTPLGKYAQPEEDKSYTQLHFLEKSDGYMDNMKAV